MTSFDYNYQNAFRYNLCYADCVTHERFFTKEKILNQSISQSTLFKCHWGKFSIAANWRHYNYRHNRFNRFKKVILHN